MTEDDKIIKKGPIKRNPASFQILQDIVIPAGTLLRWTGGDNFGCGVEGGKFSINGDDATAHTNYRKVIAA